MSVDITDYDSYRILGSPPPTAELVHPTLKDFDGTPVANIDGAGNPWIDSHKIYKGQLDWDSVWNLHAELMAEKFFQSSVRIGRLYKFLGIDDPEADIRPGGAGAITDTPYTVANLGDTTYVYVAPDGSNKVQPIQDGDTTVNAIARLESIVGTRSFTGDPIGGKTWKDFESRDGYWITDTTTITHNLDELDQIIGFPIEFTGYTGTGGSGFWNTIDLKDPNNPETAPQWSIQRNFELLNRAVGSREIPNENWNLSRNNEKVAVPAPSGGFTDNQHNVTDFIIDINNILGNRAMQFPIGSTFGLANQYPIQNQGGISDNTTYTAMLSSLNSGIGHRIIEQNPTNNPAATNFYALKSQSGLSVTSILNKVDLEIGNRYIANQTGSYPFKTSSGATLTAWANTTNDTFGDRVISNITNFYPMRSSLGQTMTQWINTVNQAFGNRTYTSQAVSYATSDETTSASIQSIAAGLKNLDDWLGHTSNDATLDLPAYEFVSLVYTNGSTDGTRNTDGWMPNNLTTIMQALQAIIDRIDDISGYGL